MGQIVCQECGADLHGTAVDFSSGQPKCNACGAVVIGGREGGRRSAQLKAKMEVPASIQVQKVPDGAGGQTLTIRVPWRLQSPSALTQLSYAGIVGAAWYLCAVSELGGLITLAVVVFVGLVLFAMRMMNSTLIKVGRGYLSIDHAPLPWLSRVIEARTLEQIYVDRRPIAQKKFDYSVRARIHDEDDELLLFRSLADPVVALYLEQSLEQSLHIADAPISGEFLPEHMLQPQQHTFAKPSNPSLSGPPPPMPSTPPYPPPRQ